MERRPAAVHKDRPRDSSRTASAKGAGERPAVGKSGRRPGKQDTRGAILLAARRTFAAKGFAGASIRAIAAEAGVDAALVHHYFDTKQQLFLSTVQIPVSIPDLVQEVTAAGVDGLGERLLRMVLQVWESEARPALVAALRTVIADPAMTQAMRQFLSFEVLGRLLAALDIPPLEAERRAGLVASQLVGVLATRYLVELPAVARQTPEELIAAIGPVLQRYFDGDFQNSEEQGR